MERKIEMYALPKRMLGAAIAVAGMLTAVGAQAGGTIAIGEDKSVSVGFGMRTSFTSVEGAAPDGGRSNDFTLDSARLYMNGSLNKYIKGMFNTEKSGGNDTFQVIDANVQFEISPDVTIWAGRFLSPSDRANMAGPYYSLGGGYWANIASRYGWNGGIIGRDNGVAVVGNLMDGKLGYSAGAFEGHTTWTYSGLGNPAIGSPAYVALKPADDLMYAARLQYDFWDAEPGYYGTGNYLGAKDILAIGIAGRTQGDGAVSTTAKGGYSSYNVDFLMEKKIEGSGASSLEAAYYDYKTGDVFLSEQGKAFSAAGGYIFNNKVGSGKLQPFVRYQKFDADTKVSSKQYDLGVNYIIESYNAQISGTYSNNQTTALADVNTFKVSMQFQY